jgi:2-haloacid dehalogenase
VASIMVFDVNGSLPSARAQLEHARIDGYFEDMLSADEVKRLKPAREPYALAFVARPGKALNPDGARPDLEGADLVEVAWKILHTDEPAPGVR